MVVKMIAPAAPAPMMMYINVELLPSSGVLMGNTSGSFVMVTPRSAERVATSLFLIVLDTFSDAEGKTPTVTAIDAPDTDLMYRSEADTPVAAANLLKNAVASNVSMVAAITKLTSVQPFEHDEGAGANGGEGGG